MKIVVIDNGNNTVGILVPVESCGLTLEQIIQKDCPQGKRYAVVESDTLPQDRMFRNAWQPSAQGADVHMPRAKKIAHDMRRSVREEKFKPLDIEASIPGKQEQAEAERQKIRETDAVLQTELDAAETPEELKAKMKKGGLI